MTSGRQNEMLKTLCNLVPRSLVDEAEGEILAFGFVHKRSGNEIKLYAERHLPHSFPYKVKRRYNGW